MFSWGSVAHADKSADLIVSGDEQTTATSSKPDKNTSRKPIKGDASANTRRAATLQPNVSDELAGQTPPTDCETDEMDIDPAVIEQVKDSTKSKKSKDQIDSGAPVDSRQDQADIARLRKERNDLQAVVAARSNENAELLKRLKQQETAVTGAQNAALALMTQNMSVDLLDDQIRRDLRNVFDDITEWARDNSSPTVKLSETLAHKLRWQERGLMRTVADAGAKPNLNFDFEADTAVDTMLDADLAERLCHSFLKNPFFFAADMTSETTASADHHVGSTPQTLLTILEQLLEEPPDGEADVHSWRAMTVKTLHASPRVRDNIHTIYEKEADRVLNECAEIINTETLQDARDSLVQIITTFGELAIKLWSQKPDIRFYNLNSETFQSYLYQCGDQDLELARAVALDPSDPVLQNRPIPVVVQPLIVARGTAHGKKYDEPRTWAKAVVWVSKDNKRSDRKWEDYSKEIKPHGLKNTPSQREINPKKPRSYF